MRTGRRMAGVAMFVVLLATAVFGIVSPVDAQARIALVVGNSAYRHVAPLDNPRADAILMADTLRSLGFALVGGGAQLDVERARLEELILAFGERAQGADVGLFYYAGHGVQVRGSNFLVPVGANPTREADVDFQMIDAALILRQLESAGTRLNIVILDACRNNPFGGRGLRSAGAGLAQMRAPEGTLLSFATQPGNVALDGQDGHSPYTRALATTIRRPGLDLFRTFNEVGLAVMQATGNEQQPWVSNSPIRGDFFFTPPSGVAARPPEPPPEARYEPRPPTPTPTPPARVFRVLDTVSEGILNMRTGPGVGNPVVVAIPAGTVGVTVGRCRLADDGSGGPWCDATWRGKQGWVSGRFVAEVQDRVTDTRAGPRLFRVLPDVSQGILNIRRGPGTGHPLVGSIPARSNDVMLRRCRKADDGGRTPWCEVAWRGLSGWVSACCIVDAETGRFATIGD